MAGTTASRPLSSTVMPASTASRSISFASPATRVCSGLRSTLRFDVAGSTPSNGHRLSGGMCQTLSSNERISGHRPQRPLPEDSAPTTRRLRRRIILGHHRDGIVGESHDPVGKQSLGRYVVETGAGHIRDDLRTSTRAEGQPGIERGFDDVRGDGRCCRAASGSRWIAGCYRYAVHQRPRPGARLVPERSRRPQFMAAAIVAALSRRAPASAGVIWNAWSPAVSVAVCRHIPRSGHRDGREHRTERPPRSRPATWTPRCDPGGMRRRAPNPWLPAATKRATTSNTGQQACDLLRRADEVSPSPGSGS